MNAKTIAPVLAAVLIALAGCTGAVTTTASPNSGDDVADTSGTVQFYISDEKNAIGDFQHLNVTVSKIGFERAETNDTETAGNATTDTAEADDGEDTETAWVERDVDNRTVDLTRLQGANSTLIGSYDVPNGTYTKTFVYVAAVNATLEDGSQVNVKLPSEKLHLNTAYTVGNNESVDFVFDIAVHKAGNSGKYILKPVISESGTDVPIERVDDDADREDGEDALTVEPTDTVTPGENVTLSVTDDGDAVANATVAVNDETVGTTDADGQLTVTVPDTDEFEVSVSAGEREGEFETEFDDDAETDAPELDAMLLSEPAAGENVTLSVTRDDEPVADATVAVNGETVGTTDDDGRIEVAVPTDAERLTVAVTTDDAEQRLTVPLGDD